MQILIDMDDTITDLEGRVREIWAKKYPNKALFAKDTRSNYYIGSDGSPEDAEHVFKIIHEKGFYASLHPKEGSIEAISIMIEKGHEIYLVTSAGINYPNAASEKYRWVEEHLFKEMISHLVITPSKYLVQGDILIDDKPEHYREAEANWEHVLFDAPYNKNIESKRRLNWHNWESVLEV